MEGRKRVLHLAWEFYPYKVGGLGTHIEYLAKAQAKSDEWVPYVITPGYGKFREFEDYEGVKVYRFDANGIVAEDFPSWALQMNEHMISFASDLIVNGGIEIIHAHDWLVSTAGVSLKHIFRLPLISTIHSLEKGRRNELHNDREFLINDLEARLAFESWYVIACSMFMKNSVSSVLSVPYDKIHYIPNGVIEENIDFDYNVEKNKYALPDEKIVLFMGRHVWEKGLDVFADSIPKILEKHPYAKFVITGKGYMTDQVKAKVYEYGVSHKVLFTGFIDDDSLKRLIRVSDILVVPSRYEPFGIVALEGMINKVPVVVSDVGGLAEIISHEYNGMKAYVDNPDSVFYCVDRIFSDSMLRDNIVKNAYYEAKNKYSWNKIAKDTLNLYDKVLKENENNHVWKSRFKEIRKSKVKEVVQ